jgi:hypothetical protein
MATSKRAEELQIKSLDETVPSTGATKSDDPRVEAFLSRLRAKAESIDALQQENHVTPKVRSRRPVADQAANPDWYQPTESKKAVPAASSLKRTSSSTARKAKTS